MPEPTPPEAVQVSSPRRGKWRRRIFRGVFVIFVLLVLFHQPLLRWGVRLVAIRLAARENVRLSLEIEGSVWTNLTLKNVRAVPTGVSPVESITIERLRIEYSLQTYFRSGPRDCLSSYNLRNASLVLDPIHGNEDQRKKLAQVLRDILQQPAMYSDRAQIENFNLTIHDTDGVFSSKGVHALLDPVKPGYLRVGELTIPNVGSWRDLYSGATYIDRHLVLRDFSLGDEVHVGRLELDASERNNGVRFLSFEGTVLGGDLGLRLWERESAQGKVHAELTAFLSNMPMEALRKYAGWKLPVSGILQEARIQVSGDPVAPAGWKGELVAQIGKGSVGAFAVENASTKISLGDGVARVETLQFSTGNNRLTLQTQQPLPQTVDQFHFSGLEAEFTLEVPDVAGIHAAFTGGRIQSKGHIGIQDQIVSIAGNVTASGVEGKDFGIKQGSSEFYVMHSLHPNAPGVPWYAGFSGFFRVEADDLRYQQFAAKHLLLHIPMTQDSVRIEQLILDINGKDKLEGGANLALRKPFAYQANLAGSVKDIGIFQPFIEKPIGGALEINWHGSGEVESMRHSGEGRIVLHGGHVEMLTHVEGEIAGTYSPESIDVSALEVRSDQASLQAGVHLRNERLHVDALRLTVGNAGVVTGSLSLPLDLRTPTRPETIFPPSGAVQGNLVLDQIDLAKVFPATRPGLAIRGMINGSLTAGGTLGVLDLTAKILARGLQSGAAEKLAPAMGDATLVLKNKQLVLSGSLAQPGLSPMSFTGAMPLVLSKVLAERQIDPETPIAFSVKLPSSPAGLFAPFIPGVRLLEGRVSVDASATGSFGKPVFNGGVSLDLPAIRFMDADLPGVNHVQGDLRFSGTELTFHRCTGDVAGGPFSVTGRLRLEQLTDPMLDLRFQSQGTLLIRNDSITLRTDSDLHIVGPVNKAGVSGNIGITKSRFFREVEILPIGLPGRPAPKPASGSFQLSTETLPFRNWTFDVAVQTNEPFTVKGNLANGSIEGHLHLGGTGLAPTLEGAANIENFVASLPFSRLTLDHGTLYFSGNAPLNPTLDIHGSSRVRDYNINVYLYGTASEPQTLFTSEPSLPQEEIVALMATGATTREFAQNNQALAGRAAVLLFQDLYRKAFPRRNASANANPMDRFSLDVGGVDPRTGKQQMMGKLKLTNEFQVGAGVDMQGEPRMQLQYLMRFR